MVSFQGKRIIKRLSINNQNEKFKFFSKKIINNINLTKYTNFFKKRVNYIEKDIYQYTKVIIQTNGKELKEVQQKTLQ